MEKTYNPHTIEQHWYQTWEKNNYFVPSGQGQPYCIMIPPPNVTGSLHMGHAFQYSLMDTLIRYHRMQGDNTLWQVGTDHAGIATQMVVERELEKSGQKRLDLGRDAFVEKVWQWKKQYGGNITTQFRRTGISVDWQRERFTMDAGLSKAVNEVFVRLYNEGLIYRGKRLVNWDPKFRTAISALEVISTEEQGHLWHIRYPIVHSDEHIVIATTRPETMLGDVAIAVHPDDKRYQHLHGQYVHLPLTNRTIPIITDDYVDQEFGSGCVKITPAHDFNDYAIGQRHDLPSINILTPDAHLNHQAPEAYQGLDRFVAREKIIEDLKSANLLEKIEAHTLNIPRGDRSGVVIEPYLTDQWFVKVKPLAEPAISAVENGDIRFVPENWTKIYYQWMHNIEDWCISRQLWWGHRIPAWYDNRGNVYVGENENHVREKYQLAEDIELNQDEDVLDTWFSSALWPMSTLGWPETTQDFETFYPTQVLVTGFDIIFFWIARMIMMGLKFTGKVPFTEVYVTGLIRDQDGQKMSKSKGNVLDPIDLIDGIDLETLISKRTQALLQPAMAAKIEKATKQQFPEGIASYGTDALRFTYCALASTGRDIRFDLGRLDGYRNFCNKIWNAARYVLMNCESHAIKSSVDNNALSIADKWIKSLLQKVIRQFRSHLENYRFDLAAQTLYEFTWNEYCDWYLELSKPVLVSENFTDAQKQAARQTLVQVLETLLRLLHPMMPFITEEIWQKVAPLTDCEGASIMIQPFPQCDENFIDENIEAEIAWMKSFILGIRNIRGEMNIAPKKQVPVLIKNPSEQDKQRCAEQHNFLSVLAKLESIDILSPDASVPAHATALIGEMEILIPLEGLIDKTAELARLNKEVDKLSKELTKIQSKLDNPNFVNKAPAQVVAQEKSRAQELQLTLQQLQQKQAALT